MKIFRATAETNRWRRGGKIFSLSSLRQLFVSAFVTYFNRLPVYTEVSKYNATSYNHGLISIFMPPALILKAYHRSLIRDISDSGGAQGEQVRGGDEGGEGGEDEDGSGAERTNPSLQRSGKNILRLVIINIYVHCTGCPRKRDELDFSCGRQTSPEIQPKSISNKMWWYWSNILILVEFVLWDWLLYLTQQNGLIQVIWDNPLGECIKKHGSPGVYYYTVLFRSCFILEGDILPGNRLY